MSTFFQKLNSSSEENVKNSQPILVIIFRNFTTFQYRFNSKQLKRSLMSSITNLVCELPWELPNDLRFKILEKQEISDTQPSDQSPIQKLNFDNSKKYANVDVQVFLSVQFYWISLLCSKQFVRDCNQMEHFR